MRPRSRLAPAGQLVYMPNLSSGMSDARLALCRWHKARAEAKDPNLAEWRRDSFQRQSWIARWAMLSAFIRDMAYRARQYVNKCHDQLAMLEEVGIDADDESVRRIVELRVEALTEYRATVNVLHEHLRRYKHPYRKYKICE